MVCLTEHPLPPLAPATLLPASASYIPSPPPPAHPCFSGTPSPSTLPQGSPNASELNPLFLSRSSQSVGTTQLRQSSVTVGMPGTQPSLLLGVCLGDGVGQVAVCGASVSSSSSHSSGFLSYQFSLRSSSPYLGPVLQPALPHRLLLRSHLQSCYRP